MPFYLESTDFIHVNRPPGPFKDAHNTQDKGNLYANSHYPTAVLNGKERAEAQFTMPLDAAGLKVVIFWSVGAEMEGLVEAVLQDQSLSTAESFSSNTWINSQGIM